MCNDAAITAYARTKNVKKMGKIGEEKFKIYEKICYSVSDMVGRQPVTSS